MDTDLLLNWFHHHFVPAVTKHMKDSNLPFKALLHLDNAPCTSDNAPAYPDIANLVSNDGNIKAMFLPANTTVLIEPIDQGVLEAVKRRY